MNTKHWIILTRDSVCAADDCFAPHLRKWSLGLAMDVQKLMQKMKDDYLPTNIQGGKATWVVKSKAASLAVIAQQWEKPKLLCHTGSIASLQDENGNLEIQVEYRAYDDADKVFKELQQHS
jgi:hypothetical protein